MENYLCFTLDLGCDYASTNVFIKKSVVKMYLNDCGTRILYRNTDLFKFEDPFEYCSKSRDGQEDFLFHRNRTNFFVDRSRIIIVALFRQVLFQKLTNIVLFLLGNILNKNALIFPNYIFMNLLYFVYNKYLT